MRKTISLILACLTSMALAAGAKESPAPPTDDPPAEVPADAPETSGEEGEEPVEDDGPSAEELAALEAAAAKAAEEEKARQAKAAIERAAAKGEKHDTLTTKKGREYNKVTIRGVDAVGLKIFHEAGTARIPFAELPEKFQQRFGYDPARAEELLKQEKELESARVSAAIARVRAEAGLPPDRTTGSRPGTTRPTTTRPKTTRPTTTRPKTTSPRDGGTSAPPVDNAEIAALNAKIAGFEAQIAKITPIAKAHALEAKKIEDKVFENVGNSTGDPKLDQAKLAKAKEWHDKAQVEYDKVSAARSQITKLKREIKKIERGLK